MPRLEFRGLASAAGVQPIIGCQIAAGLSGPPSPASSDRDPAPVGYWPERDRIRKNLMRLNSCLYLTKDGAVAHRSPDELGRIHPADLFVRVRPDGPVGRLLARRPASLAAEG